MTTTKECYEISFEELQTLFAGYLRRVPLSLAVRSTMRVVGLSRQIPRGSQVLDVGCGDGCFGELFPQAANLVIDGVDLSKAELTLAQKTGCYRHLQVADISTFVPPNRYDVAIGNCSMEHVPNIHQALANIRTALKPEGRLLLSVPAFGWARTLSAVGWTERRSTRLGMAMAGALDGFFQHHHLYGHQTWKAVLEGNGYRVQSIDGLGGVQLNSLFEAGLAPAFLEFLFKSVFHRYPRLLGRLRRIPSSDALTELWKQPIPPNAAHCIEYVIKAVPID